MGYGAYFYLRPYTINSPVSTPHAQRKLTSDPVVVNSTMAIFQKKPDLVLPFWR